MTRVDPHGRGKVGAMELLPLPEVARQLGIKVTRVHQLVRDGHLLATRDESGSRAVPASFLQDGAIVKWLPSVITQLRDARFSDDEIIAWLHRDDESLPGCPIEALRANRGSEIKRRAQVAGY
jgi:predicted DNA-binding transcriptional regulator AlpA